MSVSLVSRRWIPRRQDKQGHRAGCHAGKDAGAPGIPGSTAIEIRTPRVTGLLSPALSSQRNQRRRGRRLCRDCGRCAYFNGGGAGV